MWGGSVFDLTIIIQRFTQSERDNVQTLPKRSTRGRFFVDKKKDQTNIKNKNRFRAPQFRTFVDVCEIVATHHTRCPRIS